MTSLPPFQSRKNTAPTLDDFLNAGYIKDIGGNIFDGRYGLPNLVREKLLQQRRGCLALVLDVLMCCRVETDLAWTAAALYRFVERFGINWTICCKALHDPAVRLIAKQRKKTGAPVKYWQFPTLAELLFALQIDKDSDDALISDPLRWNDVADLSRYKLALYREHLARASMRNGNQFVSFSRAHLAKRLGISPKTTRRYDKLLQTDIRSNIELISTTSAYELISVQSHFTGHQWLEAYENVLDVGRLEPVRRGPVKPALWYQWIKKGWKVVIARQRTNWYYLAPTGAYCADPLGRGWSDWYGTPEQLLERAA